MNKQLLSIVSLVALAVTQPSIRLTAAPADGPGSTAESDRKFLSNLENKEAAQPAPAEPAPQPQVVPTPVPAPVQPAEPAAQSRPRSAQNQTVIYGNRDTAATSDAPALRTTKSVTPRTDAAPTRTTTSVPARRPVTVEQSEPSDVQADSPGVRAKIYKSRSGDDVAATSTKSSTRRTRSVAVEEEGTHIVQPAEIAQYGVAPTVPTKTTKVTTTYVQQQPAIVVRKEDGNEGRDENRKHERKFFDRLFHGGLFNKHDDDD